MNRYPLPALVAFVIIVVWAGVLFGYQLIQGPSSNERFEYAERLGSEVRVSAGNVTYGETNDIFAYSPSDAKPLHLDWSPAGYEFSRLLPHSNDCRTAVSIIGADLRGLDDTSSAIITLNGTSVANIRFARDDFGTRTYPYGPRDLFAAPIVKSPLFKPSGYTFPIAHAACSLNHIDIGIVLKGSEWHINNVALAARFTPQPPSSRVAVASLATLGIIELLGFAFVLAAICRCVYEQHGYVATICTTALLALSLVTHDEWDFPVWLRFSDLLGYGNGMPSHMWAGTPLWAFIPSSLWPIEASSFTFFGNGGVEIVALFLKLAMAMAFVVNALIAGAIARPKAKTLYFMILLLAPVGLYELSGGYREIFSATGILFALLLVERRQYVLGACAVSFAASISESMIVFIALPAAMFFIQPLRSLPSKVALGISLLGIPVSLIALEWLFLLPHDQVGHALTSRLVAYRYGGASWLGALQSLGVLPSYISQNVGGLSMTLGVALTLPIVIQLARDLRNKSLIPRERIQRLEFDLIGLTIVIYIAFAGIDPNDWYPLFAVIATVTMKYFPSNPYPLLLGFIEGLTYYSIVGSQEFVNQFYIRPHDDGLFGTLGKTVGVGVIAVDGMLLALYIAIVLRRPGILFSQSTRLYVLLMLAAFAAATMRTPLVDFALTCFVTSALLATIQYLSRRTVRRDHTAVANIASLAGITGFAPFVSRFGAGSVSVASIALIAGSNRGMGICDAVFVAAAMLELASQASFGWISILGYFTMSLVGCWALFQILLDRTTR